jgi:hypothetical protein
LGDIVRHPLGWLAVVISISESLEGAEPSYAIEAADNKTKPGKYAWWTFPEDYGTQGNLELYARRPIPEGEVL